MMRAAPSPSQRALSIAIAVVLFAGGISAYLNQSGDNNNVAAAASSPAPVAAPPARDLEPVADLASIAVATIDPSLPIPEPSPANERAPTPDVRLGTIELPSIGISDTLHDGVTLTAIDRGPSHWPGTAMPGGLGNVVVAGHRTTHSKPFGDLDLLKVGDPLIFTTDAGRFTYHLTSTEIVPWNAIHVIDQGYAFTATLFACHPKGSARFRIVGHFELVSREPAS